MVRSRLEQHDQELLRAEQRGADFGIYVALTLPPPALARADEALATTLLAWPSLRARVARAGGAHVVVDSPPPAAGTEWITAYAATRALPGQTILAARGGRLLRYYIDEAGGLLHVLGHHLVLDADSLDAFIADLDHALAGEAITGAPEWPWPVDDSHAPDLVLTDPADGGLVPAARPADGTHIRRTLEAADAADIAAAARAAGATPFALYWAAGARLGEAQLGAVVSTRLTAARRLRAGNATAYLSVANTAAGQGRDFVRSAFEDVIATWAGTRDALAAAADQLLVSHAQLPATGRFRVIEEVALGGYVVKYPRHLQIQTDGERVVLEAYSAAGGDALLDAYAAALAGIVDECLGTEADASPEAIAAQRIPSQNATISTPAAPADPLTRILAAGAHEQLRDLGISSLDVLAILEALGTRHGIRAGVEDFYTWESAGDVQALVATTDGGEATAGGAAAAYDPEASVVLPHLNDIFIDAFRHANDDPYAVEFAFVIDPTLARSRSYLAAAVQRVITRHEVFGAALSFSREGVVLRPRATRTGVRVVVADTYAEVRDPQRLTLRAPAHLADVAVAHVGDELAVYLNVHHLLVDHLGLANLLDDLSAELTGATPRPSTPWSLVTPLLDQARDRALSVWRSAPPLTAPAGVGGLPGGGYRRARLPWGRGSEVDLAAELAAVGALVAEFTGARRGVIGSVHHGRSVPGSDRLVGNLARMLPAHYDIDDPAVAAASAKRLLAGQAATLTDLAVDPGTPMPAVFHVLREDDALPAGVVRRVEYPARTKFGLLLTLVVTGETRELDVVLADDLYSAADADRLFALVAAAASDPPVCPAAPARVSALAASA